jgi:hypothetical protein
MEKFLLDNKDLINILSGIGTFVSSIIALYTLREVIKQRLSTYKPEILIKSFVVYIHKSPLELQSEELLLYKSANFNEYKKNSEENISKEFGVSCLYKVENLGFGPAKKLKLSWNYNTQKALSIIEKMFPDRYYFNQYKPLNYYFLVDKSNTNYHFSITNETVTKQDIDYLTPINIKEHSHYHSIPKEIILTYYLYYIFKNNLINTINENCYGNDDFGNLPKPHLKMEYEDINGKKYSKDYKFKISLVSTQNDNTMEMDKEFGYLLFTII